MLARMETKPFYQSKTIAGAVILLVSLVLQLTSSPAVPEADLEQAAVQLDQVISGISGLVGFGLVVWGRIKGSKTLTISNG